MLKKVVSISVVLSVVVVLCILFLPLVINFQGYRKVIVSEDQASAENFGSENSPKVISFVKKGSYLYVWAGLSVQMETYQPVNGAVYHVNGFEIVVSEVHGDWFVLLVKAEWQ
ncbi:MAG: hypothetical protein LAN71_17495 [Acidobacteriia bacterium]|nr:hypothetical protein [Terriglobia bacterium]